MSDKKMRVGDKLYMVSTRNSGRSYWCKVTKIGRKYFYIMADDIPEWQNTRFHIDSWEHDGGEYSGHYNLYESKSEYELRIKVSKLSKEIREVFYYGQSNKISNEQVLAIADILNIELKEG